MIPNFRTVSTSQGILESVESLTLESSVASSDHQNYQEHPYPRNPVTCEIGLAVDTAATCTTPTDQNIRTY